MIYEYRCDECGNNREVDIPMHEDKPARLKCSKCSKLSMHRVFGDKAAIVIPHGWGQDSYKFDKSPSGRKHLY